MAVFEKHFQKGYQNIFTFDLGPIRLFQTYFDQIQVSGSLFPTKFSISDVTSSLTSQSSPGSDAILAPVL
jgi:hypothetical protein